MKLLVCVLLVAASVACAEEKPQVETEKKFEKRGIVKTSHQAINDQSAAPVATSSVSISFGNKEAVKHSNINHGDTKLRNIERLNNLGPNYGGDSSAKLLTSNNFDSQRIKNNNAETQKIGNKNFESQQIGNTNFGTQPIGNINFEAQQSGNTNFGSQHSGNKNFGAQQSGNTNFGAQQSGNTNFETQQIENKNFGNQRGNKVFVTHQTGQKNRVPPRYKGNNNFGNNFRDFENSYNSYAIPHSFTTNIKPDNSHFGNNFDQPAPQSNEGGKLGSYSTLYGGVHTNAGDIAFNKPPKDVAGVSAETTPDIPIITGSRAHSGSQELSNVYLDPKTGELHYKNDRSKENESENNFDIIKSYENNDSSSKEKDSEPSFENTSSLENKSIKHAHHFAEGPSTNEGGSNMLDWTPLYKNPYEYSGADVPITQPIKKSYMGNNFQDAKIYIRTPKRYEIPKYFVSSPKYLQSPKQVETPKYYLTPVEQKSPHKEKIESITIQKEVKYPVLKPYPVAVYKHIGVPVLRPVAYHVDKPYPVYVAKPYHVPVYKPVPYTVIKHVPYTVHIPIKVPVFHHIPVHIPKPVPYDVPFAVKVPVAQHYVVPKPIPVYYKSHKSYHK